MPATGSLQLVEAVVERFEGAPVGERRRWSDDFKEQAVRSALEPGGNVSALARRLGISPAQLFGWRRAFLNKGIEAGAAHAPEPMVEIVIGDVTIRVSPALSETAPRWPQSSVWPGLWPWGGLPGRPCSRQPLDLLAHDQLTGSVKPDQMESLLADVDPDHGEFFYASFLLRTLRTLRTLRWFSCR